MQFIDRPTSRGSLYSRTVAARSNWTAEENSVVVRAYLDMLRLELTGQAYSKTDFRRQVRTLIDRSDGSIEYKLQNVSSALYEINHPFIDGYKPARNLQDAPSTGGPPSARHG